MWKQLKVFLPAIFFALILVTLHIYSDCIFDGDNKEYLEILDVINIISTLFLSFCIIIITLQIARKSDRTQRDALRLQLFDKRYEVFRVIADSYLLITTDDITDDIIGGKYANPTDIHKAIGIAKEDMRRTTTIAQCLLPEPMVVKIREANLQFVTYCKMYYNMLRDLNLTEEKGKMFNELYSQLIESQSKDRESIEKEMSDKFPDVFDKIQKINEFANNSYNECIINSGLMADFDKFLIIHNIDK